jgi:hypothetical protein
MILSFSLTKYIKKVKNKNSDRKTRTRSTCFVNWFLEIMVNHGLTMQPYDSKDQKDNELSEK